MRDRLRHAATRDVVIATGLACVLAVLANLSLGAPATFGVLLGFALYGLGNVLGYRHGLDEGVAIATDTYEAEIDIGRQVLAQLRVQERAAQAARRN